MKCVQMVVLNEECLEIAVGEWYYMLKATIIPYDATCPSLKWTSSNSSIVSVNESTGWIRGVRQGVATVYATAQDGSRASDCCLITVSASVPVRSITLNETSVNLVKNQTFDLNATVSPSNATYQSVTWTSSKPYVASVNGSGLVTAKSKGATWVKATATDGSGVYGACSVVVSDSILVTGIDVFPASRTLLVGRQATLNASVWPTNAENKCVKWLSSDTSVATVNEISDLVQQR